MLGYQGEKETMFVVKKLKAHFIDYISNEIYSDFRNKVIILLS